MQTYTSYTYDLNNRLTLESKTQGSSAENTRYTYDPNGNQISKFKMVTASSGSGNPSIVSGAQDGEINTYNALGQLTELIAGTSKSQYVYRPDGLRANKTVNGTTTRHLWDLTDMAAEIGSSTTAYLRGNGLVYSKTGTTGYYYRRNAHGDVYQKLNTSGSAAKTYRYDAFGNEVSPDANDTNPWRYCGEYFDKESGTVYLRARYYDPGTGRFTSEDPAKDGLNWYAYCYNNPNRFVDPSGMVVTKWDVRNCTSAQIAQLTQATNKWNAANARGDKAGMSSAHAKAEAIRNKYRLSNEVGTGNGYTTVILTAQDRAAGITVVFEGSHYYKNVTAPLSAALANTTNTAEGIAKGINMSLILSEEWAFYLTLRVGWFYEQVKSRGPWDIKRQNSWNKTIASDTFPGVDAQVYYNGMIMTPEALGNYTYGYIGAGAGFSLEVLYSGSWYAAGFPTSNAAKLLNEFQDWGTITKGYGAYNKRR